MSKVDYIFPRQKVSVDDPEEDFNYLVKQTFVHYRHSDEHEEVVRKGPRLPLFLLTTLDNLSLAEVFSTSMIFTFSTEDSISISEVFDARLTEQVFHITEDSLSVSEVFAKELIAAIRRSAEDEVSVLEDFEKELVAAIRRSTSDQLSVAEDFDFSTELTVRENTEDSLSISEIFNSALVETIRTFRDDSLSVSEIFSKELQEFEEPTNVSASHTPIGSNQITWDYTGENIDHFDLEADPGTGFALVNGNIPGGNRIFTHSGCGSFYDNNDIVIYRIRAVSPGGGLSNWALSNSVTITNC